MKLSISCNPEKIFPKNIGSTYDQKMMTGFIRKKSGFAVGQNREGNALVTVFPFNHQQRKEGTLREVNLIR